MYTFRLHYGDLTDSTNLIRIIQETQPDEIYNLAAMSHVQVSFETPEYTANADGIGTLRILEAVRLLGLTSKDPDLPGFHFRTVRTGTGRPPNRNDAFLSPFALCRGKIVRVLDHRQLPGSL